MKIFKTKFPKEDILHAFKTVYAHKITTPNTNTNTNTNTNANNTNVGNDSFLYELNLKKIDEDRSIITDDKLFKKIVIDKLDPLITKDKET